MKSILNRIFKVFTISLVIVFSFVISFSFIGCTQNSSSSTVNEPSTEKTPPATTITLKLSHWGGATDKATYEKRALMVEQKFKNIKIEPMNISNTDYNEQIKKLIAENNSPDIIQIAENYPRFSENESIIPLDEYISKNNIDMNKRYGNTIIDLLALDGKKYFMPDRVNSLILYYNKDMFDKANIKYPTKEWTWTDFTNASKKLTIRKGDTVKQWGYAAGDWWAIWAALIAQNGGNLFENGKPTFDKPENIEAVQYYADLILKHKVAPSQLDYGKMGGLGPDNLFQQGKVAMLTTGFWLVSSLQDAPYKWDMAPLFKGKQRGTTPFFNGFCISKSCKYPKEAFDVINYLTQEEGQRPIIDTLEDAPANIQVLNSDYFKNAPWSKQKINLNVISEQSDALINTIMGSKRDTLMGILQDELFEAFVGKKKVADALKNAQISAMKILQ